MTREQARFKLLEATESRCTESFINDFLDSAAALGMLKLDEPKSPQFEFLTDIAVLLSASTAAIVTDILAQRDLKIVKR